MRGATIMPPPNSTRLKADRQPTSPSTRHPTLAVRSPPPLTLRWSISTDPMGQTELLALFGVLERVPHHDARAPRRGGGEAVASGIQDLEGDLAMPLPRHRGASSVGTRLARTAPAIELPMRSLIAGSS